MNKPMIRSKRWISAILIFILIATTIIGSSLYFASVAAEESSIFGTYVGQAINC